MPQSSTSCVDVFDRLWICYSPGNQARAFYRWGRLDECDGHIERFVQCLKSKMASPAVKSTIDLSLPSRTEKLSKGLGPEQEEVYWETHSNVWELKHPPTNDSKS